MIKSDIVEKIAESSDVPRVKAAQAVDTIIEAMKNALFEGKRIELRGFGVFQVRDRKKGVGRNPKTGVEVAFRPPLPPAEFRRPLIELLPPPGASPTPAPPRYGRALLLFAASLFCTTTL